MPINCDLIWAVEDRRDVGPMKIVSCPLDKGFDLGAGGDEQERVHAEPKPAGVLANHGVLRAFD